MQIRLASRSPGGDACRLNKAPGRSGIFSDAVVRPQTSEVANRRKGRKTQDGLGYTKEKCDGREGVQ